jgi:hypothetical protein
VSPWKAEPELFVFRFPVTPLREREPQTGKAAVANETTGNLNPVRLRYQAAVQPCEKHLTFLGICLLGVKCSLGIFPKLGSQGWERLKLETLFHLVKVP